jgi:acyl-CoA synthetase (AMP-forming)/AMP-acid ligase II/acyl carrier protein
VAKFDREKKPMSGTTQSNSAATVIEALRSHAKLTPERIACRFLPIASASIDLTFVELDRAAVRLAGILKQHVRRGDRVLMFYPPGLDFVVSFFAVLYAGGVAVPLVPPRRSGNSRSVAALIHDAEPAAVLTSSHLAARINAVISESGKPLDVIVTDTLANEGSGDGDIVMPSPDEICVLQYTSGSTSTPRGVVVTHGNAAMNAWLMGRQAELDDQSVWVSWVPHFHDLGLFGSICTPIHKGITSVLMPPAAFVARPVRWLEAITAYGGTASVAPNFAYDLCLHQIPEEDCVGLDLSRWAVAGSGAEPIRMQTALGFAQRFSRYGLRRQAVCPFYGLAEATLLVSGGPVGAGQTAVAVSSSALRRHRLETPQGSHDVYEVPSCGALAPGYRVVIADPQTRQRCAPDEVGEIWIADATTGPGYWRNPEETARVFGARLADGEGPFMRTGDLGFMRDGVLYVSGRIKDVMILRGQNLYPQDIEAVARDAAPEVADAAAFTLSDDTTERAVLIIEAPKRAVSDGAALLETVRAAVSANNGVDLDHVVLTRHRALPKTSSGKIQRSKARDMLREGSLPIQAEWRFDTDVLMMSGDRFDAIGLVLELRRQSGVQQIQSIKNYLRQIFGELFAFNGEDFDRDEALMALGVTSLGMMRIRSRVESDFMIRIDPGMLWQECTYGNLVTELHRRVLTSPLWTNAEAVVRLAEEVAQMDDEEVARELG